MHHPETPSTNAALASFLDSSPDSIISADDRGLVVDFNTAAERMFGIARSEIVGQPLSVLAPPDLRPRHVTGFARLRETGTSDVLGRRVETRGRRADGSEFPIELTIVRAAPGYPAAFIALVRDQSQQMAAEVERRALEAQLAQSQRVDTLGRFAGGIAHDFNNILTIIMGYSQAVLEDPSQSAQSREDVQQIHRAAERAAGLTRQILAFSRKQILQPAAMDLNHTLVELRAMLHRIIGEDIEITLDLSSRPAVIDADAGQIEQVVINLAINARDAMPSGGRLRLCTTHVVLDDRFVRKHLGASIGPHVHLQVSDTGEGMDAEVLAHVFEPFFTTKTVDRGTGLGLSTAYGIVKQSGGSIWVTSAPGSGATFDIYLPAQICLPVAARDIPSSRASAGHETILLVEDDDALRVMMSTALERLGYTVIAAASEADALQRAADPLLRFDLLMTDVIMPAMSGREVARQMGELRPGLRVLYMSGYDDQAIAQHGVLAPGIMLLQKPFSREGLASKVRDALAT